MAERRLAQIQLTSGTKWIAIGYDFGSAEYPVCSAQKLVKNKLVLCSGMADSICLVYKPSDFSFFVLQTRALPTKILANLNTKLVKNVNFI